MWLADNTVAKRGNIFPAVHLFLFSLAFFVIAALSSSLEILDHRVRGLIVYSSPLPYPEVDEIIAATGRDMK